VSDDAALVLAKTPPDDLLAEEKREIRERLNMEGRTESHPLPDSGPHYPEMAGQVGAIH